MIRQLFKDIEAAMRAIGFVLEDDESSLQTRHYRIVVGSLLSANENRGALSSGVVRVDRTIEVRIQYAEDAKYERRVMKIGEDQEDVVKALYSLAGQRGRFEEALVEDVPGGQVATVRFVFPGQV